MTQNRHPEQERQASEESSETASTPPISRASPDEDPDQDDKAGYDVTQPAEEA